MVRPLLHSVEGKCADLGVHVYADICLLRLFDIVTVVCAGVSGENAEAEHAGRTSQGRFCLLDVCDVFCTQLDDSLTRETYKDTGVAGGQGAAVVTLSTPASSAVQ